MSCYSYTLIKDTCYFKYNTYEDGTCYFILKPDEPIYLNEANRILTVFGHECYRDSSMFTVIRDIKEISFYFNQNWEFHDKDFTVKHGGKIGEARDMAQRRFVKNVGMITMHLENKRIKKLLDSL